MRCPVIEQCEARQQLVNGQGIWAGKLHTKESVKEVKRQRKESDDE